MEIIKQTAKGLLQNHNQDNTIYVSKDSFGTGWSVYKTNVDGCQATQLFIFETKDQALRAGRKIAEAIGGKYYGTNDPRGRRKNTII